LKEGKAKGKNWCSQDLADISRDRQTPVPSGVERTLSGLSRYLQGPRAETHKAFSV